MKHLSLCFAAFSLSLCFASGAAAMGGGCESTRTHSTLDKSVRTGTPADVEREIRKWLDDRSRSHGAFGAIAGIFSARGEQQQIVDLIEGVHEKDAFCPPGALLPLALNQGNVEVVRYLLDKPLGVKPRIPRNILFAHSLCSSEPTFSDAQRSRRREAYALLLDSGQVDVNARNRFNQSILQTCFEPELVTLFIERGARTDVGDRPGLGK